MSPSKLNALMFLVVAFLYGLGAVFVAWKHLPSRFGLAITTSILFAFACAFMSVLALRLYRNQK